MPLESRRFVKAGLVWFVAGFIIGALMLSAKAAGWTVPQWVNVVHVHALFVGWLVNMVCGFALWMLPLDRERFPETKGRYATTTINASFILLNAGLFTRIVAEPLFDNGDFVSVMQVLLVLASLAQVFAVVFFAATAWTRVRGPRER